VIRAFVSRLLWSFGIAWGDRREDADAPAEPLGMIAVRAELLTSAGWIAALAVALTALMVLGFDWSLPQMVPGALAGAAVWGAVQFFATVRHHVPTAPRLPAPPAGAVLERDPGRPLRLGLWLPVFVGLAWLVDRWELGAVFVPGQFAGYALADLAGAVLVGRWQRRHGGTVLARWNGDEPDLYRAEGAVRSLRCASRTKTPHPRGSGRGPTASSAPRPG
jgi:hypothetical protein